jgi:hypothetical protein
MKKLIVILILILISCNRDTNSENLIAPEAIASPSGIVFAKNRADLVAKASAIFGRDDILITNIEFMESKDASSAIVYVGTKKGEMLSNFVIARGKISYQASNLIIEKKHADKNLLSGDIIIK